MSSENRGRVTVIVAAFEDIVTDIRALATFRGHVLGAAIVENQYELTIPCTVCDRWVTVSLGNGDDLSITGKVLGTCRGTPWGPPAAVPMRDGMEV